MLIDRLLASERTAPRYTSYPTALQFGAHVGPADYETWLARLARNASLSLYVHVPFCREICHYCGCHTKAVRRQEPIDEYILALNAEIRTLRERLPDQCPVSLLHWGGGTPAMLGHDGLIAVVDALAACFNLAPIREHAIELDPRYIDRKFAAVLAAIGINRASLGVQELAPHVQRAIGRIQPFETVARAFDLLRAAGIDRINVDLMYGLPEQTVADVTETARRLCELRPDRIALFGYAHVPWMKKHQRLIDTSRIGDAAERLRQMDAARRVILAAGYRAIGLDHFARPDDALAVAAAEGRLHRNFQGYTTDDADALIGIGASAIGRLPEGYVQNAPDLAGYVRAVRSWRLATVRGLALSPEDRMRSRIIEQLMCDLRVDLRRYVSNPEQDFEREFLALAPYAGEGLVQLGRGVVSVTEQGRPFLRLIAAEFDSYLASQTGRFSRAI